MPAGQPTKYNPSYIPQIDEYLRTTGREQTKLPTRFGFAEYIGVNGDTLVEWEKKHKEFSAAIKRIDLNQREQLMDDGMYGGKDVNASMAIFLLKANHGMVETSRTEVTGRDGESQKIEIEIIEEKHEVSSGD